jgi:hypothetical protein
MSVIISNREEPPSMPIERESVQDFWKSVQDFWKSVQDFWKSVQDFWKSGEGGEYFYLAFVRERNLKVDEIRDGKTKSKSRRENQA